MKPYRTITIRECGEPLVCLPSERFALTSPPPYAAMGADYGASSPWMLRKSVLDALLTAQTMLNSLKQGWKIKVFDAYRPLAVQEFMVEREFALLAAQGGLDYPNLTAAQRESLRPRVLRLWAIPDHNPLHPPPHSTGAALDITLQDELGQEVAMGSPIDENSDRSSPDYFAHASDAAGQQAHQNRMLLHRIMTAHGFARHPAEWWHFSLGDQMWAYAQKQPDQNTTIAARYGRADLLCLG